MSTDRESEQERKNGGSWIGVPPQSPHTRTTSANVGDAAVESGTHLADSPDGYRPELASQSGDEGVNQMGALGVPQQIATSSTPVSSAESLLDKRRWGDVREDDLMDERGRLVGIEKIVKWRSGKHILIAVSACVVLIFFAQAVSLINQLGSFTAWARYLGFAVILVLFVVFGWAGVQLVRGFLRFRKTPALLMKDLEEFSERARLRQRVNAATEDVRGVLEGYLRRYPSDAANCSELARVALTQEEVEQLVASRADLLDGQASKAGGEGWIADFESRFVCLIDGYANRVVERYARKVGLKTAVAPTGFIDTMIVLTNAYLMLRDLFVVYNVRLSRTGTFAVLFRVSLNAFAAGQMEDLSEDAAGGFTRWVKEVTGGGSTGGGSNPAQMVATAVLGRLAEGTGNYLLFRRLGKAVIRHLRPV